jgi:hypothetical protein
MTQSEAFEANLARGNDAFVLRGKLLLNATVGTTPSIMVELFPSALGPRAAALAGVFSRYRFKEVLFKFLGSISSVPTLSTVGVLDDSLGTEGDAPVNATSVLELRSSASAFATQTMPSSFKWQPIDKTKWYYTFSGVTGSDARLANSGTLYGASGTASDNIQMEVDYTIVFSGAVDTI